MFDKLIEAFARVRLGFVAAAAAVVLGVPLALSRLTATPIVDVPREIDFSDITTDLGVFFVAVLFVMVILWGFSVGSRSFKHFAH